MKTKVNVGYIRQAYAEWIENILNIDMSDQYAVNDNEMIEIGLIVTRGSNIKNIEDRFGNRIAIKNAPSLESQNKLSTIEITFKRPKAMLNDSMTICFRSEIYPTSWIQNDESNSLVGKIPDLRKVIVSLHGSEIELVGSYPDHQYIRMLFSANSSNPKYTIARVKHLNKDDLYNNYGLPAIDITMDENFNIIDKGINGIGFLKVNKPELIEWVDYYNIQMDMFGNIVDEDTLMLFKMKFDGGVK